MNGFTLGSPDGGCNNGIFVEFLGAGSGKMKRTCQYNFDWGRINDDANAANGGSATLAQKYDEFETTLNAEILLSTKKIDKSQIVFYPNPVQSELNINYKCELKISVYNLLGRKLFESKSKTINFSNLSAGFYIIKFLDENTKESLNYEIIKK